MTKKRKQQASNPWCWYCDREFEDEKVLINHQKAKHFKCHYCHKKLNSGSGLVIHIAQLHKETIYKVPNAIEGRDTPEIEIYGMMGVPGEDLKKRREGLPLGPYKRSRLAEPGAGMLPLLAAQKAAVPELEAPETIPRISPPALNPSVPNEGLAKISGPTSPTEIVDQKTTTSKGNETVIVSAPATTYASSQLPPPSMAAASQHAASSVTSPPQYPPAYPPQYMMAYQQYSQPYYTHPQSYGYPQPPYGYPPQMMYPYYQQQSPYALPMYPQYPSVSPINPLQPSTTSSVIPPTPLLSIPLTPPSLTQTVESAAPPQSTPHRFLRIEPAYDESLGKTISGAIIMVEDPDISLEEKRSQLAKYRPKLV